ncbi:hypothetical protein SAMN05192553_103736 [Cyclobacterium xiamenense]|uniref:PorV/PorQ family protein n=1 Tax=Cyclobacterium xiamenense TaxID=1297121 RepID=A0A1H6YLX4_9BACT|nr:hypothetical protein [Cyclobacterium xiamenense]SEJ40834.1 hypothetical protein SAMN05192553_103736 [Cyclobacterium xiamenense]
MVKWILIAFFFSFRITWNAWPQNSMDHYPKGAISMGMGNASVTLSDPWAVFNNIGALGKAEETIQAFAGYDHRLGLNELTTVSTGLVIPTKKIGNLGIGISNFGGTLFNQQQIGLGIANQLGLASLGLKISYFQTNIEGFGRTARPVIELGGTAELLPGLFFGAHANNLTRAAISQASNDYLPTTVKAGISYRPSENLLVNFESEKELLSPAQFKAGVAYSFQQKLWARTGINTRPNNLFFGIGFKPRRYQIDYAMSRNFLLGFTHHFSFTYNLSAP